MAQSRSHVARNGVPQAREIQEVTGDGVIRLTDGIVVITKGSIATVTLNDPSPASATNGHTLTILSATAFAHKIDNSGGSGFNGLGATLDFLNLDGTAAGDGVTLIAWNGAWYTQLPNATIAAT